MTEKITMRVGESLVAGGPPGTAAEPEAVSYTHLTLPTRS